MTAIIIFVFLFGYMCIALESVLKINKAATALLMCVACWTLFMVDPGQYFPEVAGMASDKASQVINEHLLLRHLGDAGEILFFLMGAMTIVEIVDAEGSRRGAAVGYVCGIDVPAGIGLTRKHNIYLRGTHFFVSHAELHLRLRHAGTQGKQQE